MVESIEEGLGQIQMQYRMQQGYAGLVHERPLVLVAASIGALLGSSGWVLLRSRRSKRAA